MTSQGDPDAELLAGYARGEAAVGIGIHTKQGGLTIGAASTLESGSFFSGLIDDIRIAPAMPQKIEDVQVIGVPDERLGEEICAWVKLRPGEQAEAQDQCLNADQHLVGRQPAQPADHHEEERDEQDAQHRRRDRAAQYARADRVPPW